MDNTNNYGSDQFHSHSSDEKSKETFEKYVIFHIDSEEYAVRVHDIIEVLKTAKITPVPGADEYILGIINHRGVVIPVIDLEKKFHLQRSSASQAEHIIIASVNGTQFGFRVDEVTEVLSVPTSLIKETPQLIEAKINAQFLSGVFVLQREEKEKKSNEVHKKSSEPQNIVESQPLLESTTQEIVPEVKSDQEKAQNQQFDNQDEDKQGTERVVLIVNLTDIFTSQQIEGIKESSNTNEHPQENGEETQS